MTRGHVASIANKLRSVATPRILIPLIENHQLENGAIAIPRALQPYMGGMDRIGRDSPT